MTKPITFRNVICAYDGSSHARAAIKAAAGVLALDPKAAMTVVYITSDSRAQLPSNFNNASYDPQQFLMSKEDMMILYNMAIHDETEKVEEGIADIIADVKDRVTISIVPGTSPANALLDKAKEINADLIVMGSRGLGAIRGVLGSVSYAVLRESQIPILVIK